MIFWGCPMKSANYSKNDRLKCPVCAHAYEPKEVHMLFREQTKHIVHATCSKCEVSLFLSLEANPFGMVGIGVPTDLSYTEAVGWARQTPITADVIISVYRDLYNVKEKD